MKPLLKWRGLCSVFVALSELICKGFCWFVGLQSVVQNAPTPQVVSSGSVVPPPQKAPVQVPCPFLESCILKTPGMEITRASCLSDNSIGILDMGYCSNIRSQFHVTIIISYLKFSYVFIFSGLFFVTWICMKSVGNPLNYKIL